MWPFPNRNSKSERDNTGGLKEKIEEFHEKYKKRHIWNFRAGWFFPVLGLLLSFAVTITEYFDYGVVAALIGPAIALLIGVQKLFPWGEKAEFSRVVMVESDNLLAELDHDTSQNEQDIFKKFLKLRKYAAENLPTNSELNKIYLKQLYDNIHPVEDKLESDSRPLNEDNEETDNYPG